jgi:hypothetical protein
VSLASFDLGQGPRNLYPFSSARNVDMFVHVSPITIV